MANRNKRIGVVVLLSFLLTSTVFAQGAGAEWKSLNQQLMDLYRTGNYDRAETVAKKALEVAEKNADPEHPDVAKSLENMAALYRATIRQQEAEKLEHRAARIRAISAIS